MSKLVKKIFVTATIAIVAVGTVGLPSSSQAATVDELQAQINALLAQLSALQAQLGQVSGTTGTSSAACTGITFSRNLALGSSGSDVKCLQSILNQSADTRVAVSGVGSPGSETSYFGALTKSSVIKFQDKYASDILTPVGLTAGTGYFGPSTRTKASTLLGVAPSPPITPTTPVVPTTGLFTVSLASSTPAAGTIVDGQGFAPLSKIMFSNGTGSSVKVTNVKLKRLGVSADASLTNVYLFDGAQRLTDSATVASGVITFNASNGIFTIPANSSKTVTAGADIDGTSGETVGLGITAASDITADVAVSGVFPLNGNLMTLATATLAGVQFATDANTTPSTNTSLNPQNDFTVWQNAVSITTRSVDFNRIAFRNIGSVDADDLQNFRFYIDGVQVGNAISLLDANGYVTFDTSSAPKRLETGTRTFKLVADIIGGSSKTFRFSVRVAADANLVDTQYGVNVLPTEASSGSFPVQAGQQTIASGTITITKKANSLSGNVVDSASAVALATFEVKAAGEPVKIESLRVSFSATNSADVAQTDMDELRNGQVYANGVQIGSTADIFEDSHTTTYTTYNLGSSLIVQPGSPVELIVRADIFDSDGTNNITAGDKLRINIEGGDIDNAIGQISGTTIDAPSADVNGNYVSVATGGLTLSKYTAFPNTTYVLPLTAKKLGHFVMSANTTEAVNLNTITVDYVTGDDTNLTNLFVKFGPSGNLQETAAKATVATTSSGDVTSQGNDFSVSYTMPIGQSIHLEVYGNVSSAETETIVRVNMQVTGITASSSTTVYGTGSAAATRVEGQTITYGTGTFTVAKDGTSPSNSLVAGNQTATNAKLKFTSQNEENTLTELFLKLASGASAIVNKAILKDGSTVLATLPFGTNTDSDSNSVTDSVNFTGLNVVVPANSSKVLTVDFELGNPSTNFSTAGLALQLTVDEMVYLKSTGVKTTDATPGIGGTNPTGNTQIVFKGYPYVTADNSGLSGVFTNGSTTDLYKWKVKATGGSIAMKQFKFAVSFTDVNTENLKVDQFTLFKGSTNITSDVTMRDTDGNSVESTTFAVSETASNGSSDVLFISWDDDKEDSIGAGEEATYTLKGVPSGFNSVSGSKDSVAFTLVADNEESAGVVRKFIARDATLNTLELGATVGLTTGDVSDFIWSDVSSTAHDPDETASGSGSGDWHDGYLVEQLNLASKAWSL